MQGEPSEGCICQKCWVKMSVFHEFHTDIECLHQLRENMFAGSTVIDVKPTIDSISGECALEISPEVASVEKNAQNAPKRGRGRPRKSNNQLRSIENVPPVGVNENIRSSASQNSAGRNLASLVKIAPNDDTPQNTSNIESGRPRKKGNQLCPVENIVVEVNANDIIPNPSDSDGSELDYTITVSDSDNE